ncbi:hypothetical protein SK854_20470 [Lentzea sp. BCCO 10_0061]|uniref:Uncharacterized protein n=1 Tax=Lentzea sokolovensis TaxID=3095429 RepID=A0ABU4UYB1_9PSEU|nr:hypothetical protein [Lentzea sp. BCCO 10_0061]MDX8144505.1 hypothetical protein [Lentzea sp. BCCO 10_0061]
MTSEDRFPRQILRDYLYVDVDKVKSIAGQLDSGVPEESRLTAKDNSRTTVGWNKVLSYAPEHGSESYIQRSMLDSLFPELEEALEDGWLTDISDLFSEDGGEVFDDVKSICPEGSLFRLTADGFLFDSTYLGAMFGNLSTALAGYQAFNSAIEEMSGQEEDQPVRSKKNQPKRPSKLPSGEKQVVEDTRLESKIEDFGAEFGYSADFLRAIVRTSRGLFSPGLNLVQVSSGARNNMTVNARLLENRRYLDADAPIIGSRFGASSQSWTVVGTVGHYSKSTEEVEGRTVENSASSQAMQGKFDRNNFVRMVNGMIEEVAATGLTDLPQHPALSVIPIAVYRVIERK